jgi:hypothetical protein
MEKYTEEVGPQNVV